MTLLLMIALFLDGGQTHKIGNQFEDPAEVSDAFLGSPYDMDFAPDGRLYVVDRNNAQVLVWNKDGSFKKAFGSQGEGPGEFRSPWRVKVANDQLYVLDGGRRIHILDLDGNFKRQVTVNYKIRDFAPLSDSKFLLGVEEMKSPSDLRMSFYVTDANGEEAKQLKEWPNQFLVGTVEGENKATIRPFSGDVVIQRDRKGQWYMGYGAEAKIYAINKEGEITKTIELGLSTQAPTDDHMTLLRTMSFPGPGGQRLSLDKLPGLKVREDLDMGYYTQFGIIGDQVVTNLTPVGGTNGVGIGFSKSDYRICDLNTGKAKKRGRFNFAEDSMVLFNSGRMVAFIINDDSEFEVRELTL